MIATVSGQRDLEKVVRRARAKKLIRYTIGGLVAVVLGVGVILPLILFSSIGRGKGPVASSLPTEVQIECGVEGLSVHSPAVRPLADGVHISVTNSSQDSIKIRLEGHEESHALLPGTSELTSPQPPGKVPVECTTRDGAIFAGSFEVVDVEDLWVPPELDCENYIGWSGERGSPAATSDLRELVQYEFPGIPESDAIREAGYPEAPVGVAVVVREGRRIGSVTYEFVGADLYFRGASACDGMGLLG